MSADCWLTRAVISPRTILTRGLSDAYAWHQLVWQAFPGRDGAPRDFLTRLDDKPAGTQLLIVSPLEPLRPAWLAVTDSWETKPIPPAYFQPRAYRFQLHANPTVKRVMRNEAGEKKKNGRREPVGLRKDAEGKLALDEPSLRDWLARKGEAAGFQLHATAPLEIWSDAQRFRKTKAGLHGVHHAVDFTGILEITDPAVFRAAFARGIGSAKAFCFGMMAIAPLQ